MNNNLDDIFFLENYETILVIDNLIFLSLKKYFSRDHFKNEKFLDKKLIEIKIEEILKVSFNDFSPQVEIKTNHTSFKLIFFDNKMMLRFVSKIEPYLILEKTETDLSKVQRIIPSIFIFIVIIIISFLFGINNNLLLLISLIFVIYKIYQIYGNSKNVEYTKTK